MIIERDERELKLREEEGRIEAWHKAEAEENAKLREMYQEAIDRPRLKVMWDRVKAAGEEIKRDAAKLERAELIRRCVLKGRRG
jgi:hypothetical protein